MKNESALVILLASFALAPTAIAAELEINADNGSFIDGRQEYSGNVAISLNDPASAIEISSISSNVIGTTTTYEGNVKIKVAGNLVQAEKVWQVMNGETIVYKMDSATVSTL